jgi:hypothetical protein
MEKTKFFDLMNRLAITLDYHVPADAFAVLVEEYYGEIGHHDDGAMIAAFAWIKKNFVRTSYRRFPFIPDFKNAISEMKSQEQSGKNTNYSNGPMATVKEIKWFWMAHGLVCLFHQYRLTYNGDQLGPWEYVSLKLDFDQWIQAGCPHTGSSLFDDVQKGAVKPYRAAIASNGDELARYYYEWYKLLHAEIKKQVGNKINIADVLADKGVIDGLV